jgi:hypothetical protein
MVPIGGYMLYEEKKKDFIENLKILIQIKFTRY